MVMKALRDGASGGITKFFLMGFMALAVGGLVMMDVGGVFRGGVGSSDVAKVGDQSININSFDRTLRRSLNSIGLTPQDAYKLGYLNQVLAGEIRSHLIRKAALDKGVLVSDKRAAEQIKSIVQPLVQPGQDTKDIFNQLLRAQGMSEGEFVQAVKRDIGNNIIMTMLNQNFQEPDDALIKDLYRHKNETRSVEFVTFLDNDVPFPEQPDEEELRALYEASKESFAVEETREVDIVKIDTKKLEETLAIDEKEIRSYYDMNKDYFAVPNTWTLDQAIIPTEEQAQGVYDAAKNGAPLKEAVEDITGTTSGYVGVKDVEESGLLEELKETVTAVKTSGTLLAPINSPLGWHVIRVTQIQEAQTKPFETVKAKIRDDMAQEQIIDQLYDMAAKMDDLFAGGAPVSEVQEQMDVEVIPLKPFNRSGLTNGGLQELEKFDAKEDITTYAFELFEGETSPVFENNKGDFMAVHVKKINEKTYRPFEEVRNSLTQRWTLDQKRLNNKAFIREELAKGRTLQEIAKEYNKTVETKSGIRRDDRNVARFIPYTIANIFAAPLGEITAVDVEGGTALLKVTDFEWPEVDTESVDYRQFKASQTTEFKNEAIQAFLLKQSEKYDAKVNDRLLEQVYGASSQTF